LALSNPPENPEMNARGAECYMKKLMIVVGVATVLMHPVLGRAQIKAAADPDVSGQTGTAQTSPFALQVDVSKCIELALQNNNRTKISRDALEAALALHKQALSSWYPQISGSVLASRMDEDPNFIFPSSNIAVPAGSISIPSTTLTLPANIFGPGFPPVNVPLPLPPMSVDVPAQTIPIPEQNIKLMNRDNLLASLEATFPIYTGGLRGSRIKQAKAGIEVARQDERRTDLEVAYDVKRLYYALLMTQQLVKISKDTLDRMEATLVLTEKLYQTGSGTVKKTDYLRNKSMVETIRGVVSEMESEKNVMRTTLLMVMGLDMASSIELADKEVPFTPATTDPEALIKAAFSTNADIAKVEAAVKAAEADIGAAISGHVPKVALVGSANKIVNSYSAGAVTPENKDSWMVGIGIDIPIFQGFRVANEVREKRANLQKLRHQLALLREAIALDIRSTCFGLQKTKEQEQSSREALKSATENRELNVRAYQDELVETKDVIEAQLMEALMAGQYQKVLYDHAESEAKLDFAVGRAAIK
jgi:outer membrane protein